jgi:hypothetical protein
MRAQGGGAARGAPRSPRSARVGRGSGMARRDAAGAGRYSVTRMIRLPRSGNHS